MSKTRPPAAGRRSIYRGKNRANRVVGILTDEGMKAFERERRTLAGHVDRDPEDVSDGDTIEFAVRGGTSEDVPPQK